MTVRPLNRNVWTSVFLCHWSQLLPSFYQWSDIAGSLIFNWYVCGRTRATSRRCLWVNLKLVCCVVLCFPINNHYKCLDDTLKPEPLSWMSEFVDMEPRENQIRTALAAEANQWRHKCGADSRENLLQSGEHQLQRPVGPFPPPSSLGSHWGVTGSVTGSITGRTRLLVPSKRRVVEGVAQTV